MKLTWKNVFDAYKLIGKPDIYVVNLFLFNYTEYVFFSFNDRVFKVLNPNVFSISDSATGLSTDELSNAKE